MAIFGDITDSLFGRHRSEIRKTQNLNYTTDYDWRAPNDGDFIVPFEIDTSRPFSVIQNGTMLIDGKDYTIVKNMVFLPSLRSNDYIRINAVPAQTPHTGIQTVTLDDTESNAPQQTSEKKVKYLPPTSGDYVAQLQTKMRSWEEPDLFDLTREELEYLVTAGGAILKHLKEEDEHE